jgi:uncharacterized membrane protein
MSRIRDIANLFSANTAAATDSEVTAAISAHNLVTYSRGLTVFEIKKFIRTFPISIICFIFYILTINQLLLFYSS